MKIAVVLMGLMLVLSTVALSNTSYAAKQTSAIEPNQSLDLTRGKLTSTSVAFDMSGCTNTMTCNAELFVGDTVEFMGTLTNSTRGPVAGAKITVYKLLPKPELVPLAFGVTGIDGKFTLTWTAGFTSVEKASTDVTRKFLTETVTIFAQFDGDKKYAPSRSGKNTAIIKAPELMTFVNSDKNLYRQGDSALVFLAFVDNHDNFVDPDSLRVVLNDKEVQVEKKKTGSYTLTIPALPKEHTQLLVIPKKEGHNINNGFLTIIVDGLK